MRKNQLIVLLVFILLSFVSSVGFVRAADLVYDDFNDGSIGTNLGGLAGAMSPDANSDGIGDYDPILTFSTEKYEGSYALSISYSFPSGQWCGYWSYANDIDPDRPPNSTIDVSGYSELRMMAKGTLGTEQFKIEINSSTSEVSYTYVTVPGTGWGEIVVPLSSFTKVAWVAAPVDLSRLRQINIVFDRSPYSSTVYIDYIRFTGGTAALRPPAAQFTYSPGSPTAGTEVTFNASGSSDEDGTITSYLWNFGDGTIGSGIRLTHTYSTSGNYNVTLTVTDNDGLIDTYTAVLAISGQTSGDNQPGDGQPGGDNQPGGSTGITISINELIIGVVIIVVVIVVVALLLSRRRPSGEVPGWQ